MNILAYTDGSCLANGRKDRSSPMGAGVRLVLPDGTRRDKARALGEGTNQRAELSAIILAFEEIKAWCKEDNKGIYYAEITVDIHTDSQYAIGCLSNTKWKPKANLDLIQQAKSLMAEFKSVTFTWVKGHAGTEGNEAVDRLAVSASLERLATVTDCNLTIEDNQYEGKTREWSYLFSCGNSSNGPIGFCMRVRATSEAEALEKLKKALPEEIQVPRCDLFNEAEGIEYLSIYFNFENVTVKDIDDKEEV